MYFKQNIDLLVKNNPKLAERLCNARRKEGSRYTIQTDRCGKPVPSITNKITDNDKPRVLHSLFDAQKEADRLIGTLNDEGFIIFLGLGGGYSVASSLKYDVHQILIIDFDTESVAELFENIDYTPIIGDKRVYLLIEPSVGEIEQFILDYYQPVLMNGIRAIPLRPRIEGIDKADFMRAEAEILSAIEKVAADFSVQSYFGMRWFSNIIRNISRVEECSIEEYSMHGTIPAGKNIAVIAAGPSLDGQISLLKNRNFFIIATDTSLPRLLFEGIEPDVTISIDCQLWSYHHFLQGLPARTQLYLDLASPPDVAERSIRPRFFSSGHPLSRYVSHYWMQLPEVDTSGGNVTYAAVSLAESFGNRQEASSIELFAADFSYPFGKTYARGTWLYPFYENQQSRLSPSETFFSNLLYRSPLQKHQNSSGWYYETPQLTAYRKRLEEKSAFLQTKLIPIAGNGAPVRCLTPNCAPHKPAYIPQKPKTKASVFLAEYRERIETLSFQEMDDVFLTILPTAAALKYRNPVLDKEELLEKTREFCLKEIGIRNSGRC